MRPGGSGRGSTVACAMYDWVYAGLCSLVGSRDLISLESASACYCRGRTPWAVTYAMYSWVCAGLGSLGGERDLISL